jgi:hypothetical protein
MSECNGVVSATVRIVRARYVIEFNLQVALHHE